MLGKVAWSPLERSKLTSALRAEGSAQRASGGLSVIGPAGSAGSAGDGGGRPGTAARRYAIWTQQPAAGYRLGSDGGSPNRGSTLVSKRVIALIRSPARVMTNRPAARLTPSGPRT